MQRYPLPVANPSVILSLQTLNLHKARVHKWVTLVKSVCQQTYVVAASIRGVPRQPKLVELGKASAFYTTAREDG